ncbi:MAG TPA: metallophosphoesterase family protein [Candidatus Limnocylindrales bacterium]|nr:metallophosphoesterase family protein [Candidatus Limnocylindrales bacterium]
MRIAVLSDIHGNLPALEAVLTALAPYDAVWQLGDIVGYGPQPDEVVARLAQEGAIGVRGNHDSAAIGALDTDAFNDDARAAVEWTAERIEPATREWLAALPLRSVDEPFTLVHGSPRDPTWEYVHSAGAARANMDAFDTRHCLVGHTHVPLVFRQRDGRVEGVRVAADASYEFDDERLIVNPGSVGQPRDGDPRASAMILDTDARSLEWRRVAYPIEQVQKLMAQVALPVRLIARLQFGL